MFFVKSLTLLHFIHLTLSCVRNLTRHSRLENQTQQALNNTPEYPEKPALKFVSIKFINY